MGNCAIILAGGEGKRMKSDKPKTLSEVLGKPMLLWVMNALRKVGIDDICVVKGYKKECIEEYLGTLDFKVESVFQAERLGTGHAVMMAKDFLEKHDGNVVITLSAHIDRLCGDGYLRESGRPDRLRQNRARRKRQPQGDRRA